MDARLDFYSNDIAGQFTKKINSAGAVITSSTLPAATQEAVKIRASQINGCGVCLDMHTKDAEHAGESSLRINLVAAWREATVFTEAERAALELTEQGHASRRWRRRLRRCVGYAAKHLEGRHSARHVGVSPSPSSTSTTSSDPPFLRDPAGDYTPGQWA